MRILVAGAQGQVARALAQAAQSFPHDVICLGRPDLDLGDHTSIEAALETTKPDLVINAAAYTAVDQAETEREAAFAINANGAGALAKAAAKDGLPILHLSTDYVFDGTKATSYSETDPTAPLGVYGASKLAGEKAVAESNLKHFIFRTAWVYSPYSKNFVKTMLRLAETRDEVSVVDDQIGSPTSAHNIASALLTIAGKTVSSDTDALAGIYHLAGTGIASWADLAEAVFAASSTKGGPTARVKRISSNAFPTPTERPKNSRLDTSKLQSQFGVSLPNWQESVAMCVAKLTSPK